MKMTHIEADELLGGYALDALPAEDVRRLREHFASCAEHAAAAAELRWTQSLLALTVEDATPSPELRRRIIEAVQATPPQPRAAARAAPALASVAPPSRRAPRMPRWMRRPAYLAVAAAVLISLGIGGLIGYRLNQNVQTVAYSFKGDPSAAPGAEAQLVYFKDRKQALLAVTGLPRLTAGHIYEMWLIRGGVPQDEGISAEADGKLAIQMSADLSQFEELAITIEPGEQHLPTTNPILIGHLRGG